MRHRFPEVGNRFCGYAVATSRFKSPPVAWCGKDTAIQKDAIVRDLGVFDAPDDFFARHGANPGGLKALRYRHVFRQRINRKVVNIRLPDMDSAGCEQRNKAVGSSLNRVAPTRIKARDKTGPSPSAGTFRGEGHSRNLALDSPFNSCYFRCC